MIYSEFQDKKLSLLGFGAIRLPLLSDGNGEMDEEQVAKMVRYAADNGINYYDTAYPYHNAKAEVIIRCPVGRKCADSGRKLPERHGRSRVHKLHGKIQYVHNVDK